MREKKPKRLSYYRAETNAKLSFQDAVSSYVNLHEDAKTRHHEEKSDDGSEHNIFLINHFRENPGMCCGEFLSFEPNRVPKGIDLSASGKALELVDLLQGIPKEQRRQVIDATSYFGVAANHVILAASRSLGVREFEMYVNHQLRKAAIIAPEEGFKFVRALVQEHEPDLKLVKSISIGASLFEKVRLDTPVEQGSGKGMKKFVVQARAGTNEIFRALVGTGLEDFEPSDIADADKLSMRLVIRFGGRRADSESKVLQHLTRALRDVPEQDLEVELRGKGSLKGKELFLHKSYPLTHLEGSPDANELFTRMRDWLNLLLQQGAV